MLSSFEECKALALLELSGCILESPSTLVPTLAFRGSGWHCGRFQAVLLASDASSVFKIVETNDFNQLPHITLAFRPGNDAAIKHFLASRLSEVKLANCNLGSDLQKVQVKAARWMTFSPAIPLHLSHLRLQPTGLA